MQTGCAASGTFWAHEAWGLAVPPDAVTFSKKTQVAGYFCTQELVPKARGRQGGIFGNDSKIWDGRDRI